jgi:hypothetical protein
MAEPSVFDMMIGDKRLGDLTYREVQELVQQHRETSRNLWPEAVYWLMCSTPGEVAMMIKAVMPPDEVAEIAKRLSSPDA